MEKSSDSTFESNLARDNVSLRTVSSVSSESFRSEIRGRENYGYRNYDDENYPNSTKNVAIDHSKKIQVGNTNNYQAPVTFQVDVLHMYGKDKCKTLSNFDLKNTKKQNIF